MRRLNRFVASVAQVGILVLWGIGGAYAQATVDPKHLLVPGKSMGLVQLGMSLSDFERILGKPSYTRNGPQMVWYYFGNLQSDNMNGVSLWMQNGKVISARAFEASYRTAEGLGVGSTLPDLVAAYGTPQRQMLQKYTFNQKVQISDLYVEWSSKGVSAHIDESTQRVAFIDIDVPKP